MKKTNRRSFLINSAKIAALYPLINYLQSCSDSGKNFVISSDKGFPALRHINSNGENVAFYFVNAKQDGQYIVPEEAQFDSFMIVQIPPQSLHEEYIETIPATGIPRQSNAQLARHSFLAFKIWPEGGVKKLELKLANLLSWNNTKVFKLLTTADIKKESFKRFSSREQVLDDVGLCFNNDDVSNLGLNYYKRLIDGVFESSEHGTQFVSIFELPAKLYLVPHIGRKDVTAKIIRNDYPVSRETITMTDAEGAFKRTTEERWYMELKFFEKTINEDEKINFNELPPVLRAIAMQKGSIDAKSPNDCRAYPSNDQYLPALLNKQELIYLNQVYHNIYESPDYDIKLKTKCLFTATGASLKFHYKNFKTGDTNISLAEYEHHFQDGRDNYIRVAHIGVIAPSGQKALHVKIAKRKVTDPSGPGGQTSAYMEFKQYIEIIEPEKAYPVSKVDEDFGFPNMIYKSFYDNDPAAEPKDKGTYYQRHPFTSVKSLVSRTPPINGPASPGETYFWIYKEGPDRNKETLLDVPFLYHDREKVAHRSDHPILFLKKNFFADPVAINMFLANGKPQKSFLDQSDDGRLRMPFNGEVICFTPDDPHVANESEIKNKINQLPTDYIEYYFNIGVMTVPTSLDVFDVVPNLIYMQMRLAKTYVEQIQQYSRVKLPSLVTYPVDYLEHEFNTEKNKAKLVLEHSKDFLAGVIETIGRAPAQIENDLQNGYQKIRDVFSNAEDKIGGLVNPDIQIERFALVRDAISLPKKINEQWARIEQRTNRVVNTAEILAGKSAEIMGGIDLKMILEEVLDVENSPKFDFQKIAGVINDIEKFLNSVKNPTVVKVLDVVRNTDKFIREQATKLNSITSEVKKNQDELTVLRSNLIAQVPDISKLRQAAKLLLEKERMNFIEDISNAGDTLAKQIKNELVSELYKVIGPFKPDIAGTVNTIKGKIENYTGTAFITGFKSYANGLEPSLKKEVLDVITIIESSGRVLLTDFGNVVQLLIEEKIPDQGRAIRYLRDIYFFNKGIPCYVNGNEYYIQPASVTGLKQVQWSELIWSKVNYDKSSFTNIDAYGLQQLHDVLVYLHGVKVPPETIIVAVGKKITLLTNQLSGTAYVLANNIYDGIIKKYDRIIGNIDAKYKKALDEVLQMIDVVRKSTVNFYYDRYINLKRDITDINKKLGPLAGILNDPNVIDLIKNSAKEYNKDIQAYASQVISINLNGIQQQSIRLNSKVEDLFLKFDNIVQQKILAHPELKDAYNAVKKIKDIQDKLQHPVRGLQVALKEQTDYYKSQLELQAKGMLVQLEIQFRRELEKITIDDEILAAKAEYDKLIKLLKSVRQQEMTYSWYTEKFKKASMGIISFNPDSNPKTRLTVNVKNVIHFDPLKFPPVIERMEMFAENKLTNFSVTFLSALTVGFSEIKFVTGNSQSSDLSVKIRDVKFDGALSFIQKLEELLQSLGAGFRLELQPTNVGIGYVMPVPSISTPGFSFSNITIGVMIRIYFNKQPMTATFMLAEKDNKAIVAAGILGGGFFCHLTAEPKRGLRSIEMALEMGAYLGVNIGPIRGEVKLMVGLYYRRDDFGVTLEGYIIAEGKLSVWIIHVSARIYLYVRSQNSYVEGGCTVTYSAKVGFVEKSFSGTFRKKIAGAESKRSQQTKETDQLIKAALSSGTKAKHNLRGLKFEENLSHSPIHYLDEKQYQPLESKEWTEFYQHFFK